ncbi:helix-turn-helix domain-containing protein [Dehalobacter sp. DCM]|uniref:PucR family transcriptional regulator n=1 Tax=Dehalobacter sp. DCM TaxID=2907827 RepID=UPI003081CBA6|nr:helix-turn-helix domain-containing protein [Dehalobacter sp. DCM]
MNVNLYIFYSELAHCAVRLVAEDKARSLDISSILLLSGENVSPDSEHLYVGIPENVLRYLNCGTPLQLAIVGDFDDSAIRDRGHSAVIFPDESDLFSMFNRLQTIKEKYDGWDDEMTEAIRAKYPLQQVFDIGAKMLTNPVAMFDRSLGLVMTAGEIPDNVRGTIWEPVLAYNYSPPDTLQPKERKAVLDRLMESDWPFTYRSQILNENHLVCGLFVSGEYFGSFGSSEFKPFSEGQISILARLAQKMEWAIASAFGENGTTTDMPYYISRLLGGYNIEQNAIEYHLRRNGWKMDDPFRVLRIESTEKIIMSDEECATYKNPLKSILPKSIIFPYENGIVVILHSSGLCPHDKDLIAELVRNSLRAGVSMVYENFLNIKYAYIQSKNALSRADETLSFFELCYTECLVSALGQITSLKTFCHPRILWYWQQGNEKKRSFIRCMWAYLQNGRNLTDTAKKLGIHRNTLFYRLDKMSELLDFDIFSDSLDNEILTMLNFSCSIVDKL